MQYIQPWIVAQNKKKKTLNGSGKRPNDKRGNFMGIPGNYAPYKNDTCWMCGIKVGKGGLKTFKSLQQHMSNPPMRCLRIWKAKEEAKKKPGRPMPRL